MLEGPKLNPAKLPVRSHQAVHELFAQIFCVAVATSTDKKPVRYLSRYSRFLLQRYVLAPANFGCVFVFLVNTDFTPSSYDKSASNICESKIWATIGQTPWAHPWSTWYHRFLGFPFQALRMASRLGEYTLVDRGTWYSIEDDVTSNLEVFVSLPLLVLPPWTLRLVLIYGSQAEGSDNEDDPLLNPAHALIGAFGVNKAMATEFVNWLIRPDGGQRIIENFIIDGHYLYSPAPPPAYRQTSFAVPKLGIGDGEPTLSA